MNNRQNQIYYWRSAFTLDKNLTEYTDIAAKLLARDYNDNDLEKLKHHNIFSFRLNKADRLLFTTKFIHDEPHLLLLEVVPNHDYQKARFLRPAVLRNFLEKYDNLNYQYQDTDWLTTTDKEKSTLPYSKETIKLAPIDFNNQQFIIYNEDQEKAIIKPAPFVCSGVPGAGKTCIAVSITMQAVEYYQDKPGARLLLVTKTEKLRDKLKHDIQSHPHFFQIKDLRIECKTIEELNLELFNHLTKDNLVSFDYFASWLNEYTIPLLKAAKTRKNSNLDFTKRVNDIYEEFRILCAHTKETYLELGNRKTLFKEEQEREWIWNCYQQYINHLEKEKKADTSITKLEVKPIYDFIAADEAQDFSLQEDTLLFNLAINHQICYFMDTLQSLTDKISQRPYLINLLTKCGVKEPLIKLGPSQRCGKNGAKLCTGIINLRNFHTKGKSDQHEDREVISFNPADDDSVEWLDTISDVSIKTLSLGELNANTAILTYQTFKNEAQKYFNTPLIFSPEECKGLEYETIILFRPLDLPIFTESNKLLQGVSIDELENHNKNRSKNENGNPEFLLPYNRLFTLASRGLKRVIICQPTSHSLRNLTNYLSKFTTKNNVNNQPNKDQESTLQSWLEEARKLLLHGNMLHAKNIFIQKLNKSENDFEAFKNAILFKNTPNINIAPAATITENITHKKTAEPSKAKDLARNLTNESSTSSRFFNQPTPPEQKPVASAPASNEKSLNYINNLLTDIMFTESNIISSLFSDKVSNTKINDILFNTRLPNNNNLFIEIMKNGKYSKIFFLALTKNPALLEKLNFKLLFASPGWQPTDLLSTTPIFWMIRNHHSHPLLDLFSKSKAAVSFDEMITPELFNKIISKDDPELEGESLLINLTSLSNVGFYYLSNLLSRRLDLVTSITPDILFSSPPSPKNRHFLRSVFHNLTQLTQDKMGLSLFNLIVISNTQLFNSLTSNDLFNTRYPLEFLQSQDYVPPLFWLSFTESDHHFLEFLLKRNENLLLNHLTSDMLIASYHHKIGITGLRLSISECLQQSKSLLAIILNRNPGLQLPKQIPNASIHNGNAFQGGLDLANKITHIISTRETLNESELNEAISCLSSSICYSLFVDYLSKNPQHITKFPPALLCGKKESYNPANPPSFYKLLCLNKDSSLLPLFIKYHPELMRYFSADILCRPYSNLNHSSKDDCLFYLFLRYPEYGMPFLFELFQHNPGIVKDIPAEAICRKIIGAPAPYVSILYALAALVHTDMGSSIFNQLIKDNPGIMQAITPEAFLAGTFTDPVLSPFYLLALSEKGHSILLSILLSNKTLSKHITQQILNLKSKEHKLSANELLSRAANGKSILSLLQPNQNNGLQIQAKNVYIAPGASITFGKKK